MWKRMLVVMSSMIMVMLLAACSVPDTSTVADLEVMGLMDEDVDAKTFSMQRVLYDAYKMLGYELIRSRSYIYALIFKGKRYWLDTLSMVVKERGNF